MKTTLHHIILHSTVNLVSYHLPFFLKNGNSDSDLFQWSTMLHTTTFLMGYPHPSISTGATISQSSYFGTVDQPPHGLGSSFSQRSSRASHYDESFNTNFRQQQKQQQDAWLAANTQQVNMNSYVGMNRPWDPRKDVATTHHGKITPGVFGHFLVDQGATNNVNSRQWKTVAGMLPNPSHIASKFK